MERKFQFRETLGEIHKINVRKFDIKPSGDEFVMPDFAVISLPKNTSIVLEKAAKDFIDYLFTSMNISARIGENGNIDFEIKTENPEKITEFEILTDDRIHIICSDERSAAQALFYIEDLMNERKAPYLKKTRIYKKLEFSPRMTCSGGFGSKVVPDEFFGLLAHHGFNSILLGGAGPEINFKRCREWGLDVYCCSNVPSKYNPDHPDAKKYYAEQYGNLIRRRPEIKGIILVGEAIGFPSDDPNTCGGHRLKPDDNIPLEKPGTGFYPCEDYYKLVNIIKESVHPLNKDIEIVLWTYNWWGSEVRRKSGALYKMLDKMPNDITLMVTFELSEQYKMEGVTKFVCDYSISRVGPCQEFCNEAEYAKKRGIKLISMVSTSGSTWDYGVIPYMPMPQKWIKRYKAIYEAKKKYNLTGFLENWSYGFYPSIVSELSKKCYLDKDSDFDENLKVILKNHFGENADTVYKALDLWSEASDYIHSTYDNQYGPLRVGTAYPLCLTSNIKSPFASPWYDSFHTCQPNLFNTIYSIRLETDQMHWEKMASLMKEGADMLAEIENPAEELLKLENLGRYIYHCTMTVVNVHRWHKHRALLKVLTDKKKIKNSIEELRKISANERQNAVDSICCLRKDSKLGFENCDGYVGGEEAVLWKIKHLDYVVNNEIKRYEIELPL